MCGVEVTVPTVALSWQGWRQQLATLSSRDEPWVRKHANQIEQWLEEHAPGEEFVALPLSEEVSLRSVNWTRLERGLSLP